MAETVAPLHADEIHWTSVAPPRPPLAQHVRDLLLVADDTEIVEALALAAIDAEEFAESYRALAKAAIRQLHDAVGKIAKLRATHRRTLEEHKRLRETTIRGAIGESTDEEMVILRGGLSVPLVALKLAWKLEEAGVTLRIDGTDLFARPANLVLPEDVPLLRQHRDALKAIVKYCQEPPA